MNLDHLQYRLDYSYFQGELIPHLKVSRRDGADGISWDELQALKNEIFSVMCVS